jgi:UV DNA damage repair endonuclease
VARSDVHGGLERRGQPCSLVSQHEPCLNLYLSVPLGVLDWHHFWIVETRDASVSVLQCLLARFIYMVETTISLGGQAFDIDVEGEVERDENGAKDSAVARLMAWLREQGVSLG